MPSRENLIPMPTVDKNGRQTIVWRRGDSLASAIARLPAPLATSPESRRKLDIDVVADFLGAAVIKHNIPSCKEKMATVIRSMSASQDSDYPAVVREIVETVIPAATTTSGVKWVIEGLAESEAVTRTMSAHLPYLAKNADRSADFFSMRKVLRETLHVEPEPDGMMPTLEAHLYAKKRYTELKANAGSPDRYLWNLQVMQTVEKHPDHVHELMEFISRNQKRFSLTEFEEYLSHGTLSSGAL